MWWAAHATGLTNAGSAAAATTFGGGAQPVVESFINGSDGSAGTAGEYQRAYDLFKSAEDVDVSIILGGSSVSATAVHLINNIAEYRKDCVVCLSPEQADVVNNTSYVGAEVDDSVTFRNTLPSSSYAVLDSGYKYQYDKYNDVYRWVPLNGDTAGTMARTDQVRDPWYSPAGLTRGRIKNVVKLAFNPNKTDRDQLYKNGINPVVTFPGEGTILFGDRTLLASPSAFDRINVRRLFIVLEKAIAIAARQSLFEFNDPFTRSQFVSLVEPFLRDVQGRRGITDFRVVCDETNNTPEIIDRNEFVGDIYIKPARSINFIQLNFVAVRTGVEFDEVVGQFG
jgi:phage tail sheath protein FI